MRRILIVAQTPPPRHGQSLMVRQLLQELQAASSDRHLRVEHINLQYSRELSEIGGFSLRKILRTIVYLFRLVTARLRGPVDYLYYVPATGLRSQLYRDWLVLGLGRRLARHLLLHWHGLGLKELYDTKLNVLERWLTRWTYRDHAFSLVLTRRHAPQVTWLRPGAIHELPNFIPDPFPRGARDESQRRADRARQRSSPGNHPPDLQVLFMGHCTRTKGLFDTVEAVAIANHRLRDLRSGWNIRLEVAGEFLTSSEEEAFTQRLREPDLALSDGRCAVHFAGYLAGDDKDRHLRSADVLCLPTCFHTEAQPVVLIEALAYGLEIVVSDWRDLPAMLPDTAKVVPIQSPEAIARALIESATSSSASPHREYFLEHYERGVVLQNFLDLLAPRGP